MTGTTTAALPAFGTVAAPLMTVSDASEGSFGQLRTVPVAPLPLHPFAHVLHYGSACFEGLKAHRGRDGVVRLFRLDRHVARLRGSARLVQLPVPPAELLTEAIVTAVQANLAAVPEPPGALYLRPLLIGTEPNIGAAAVPSRDALLVVLASPVGDYLAAGDRTLTVAVTTTSERTVAGFGEAKAGANYLLALGATQAARAATGADQVLFAPGGRVQESGAANLLLLAEDRIATPALDGSFLAGVTRDAVLTLARDRGFVVEERTVTVPEVLTWPGEAALSGTAAVLTSVGRFVHAAVTHELGDGGVGPVTTALRADLQAVQRGDAPDQHGWTLPVTATGVG